MGRARWALGILIVLLVAALYVAAQADTDYDTSRLLYDSGDTAYTRALAIAPDGGLLAIGSSGGDTLLIDVAAGTESQRLPAQDGGITSVAFSPDSRYVLSSAVPLAAEGSTSLTLWDTQEQSVVWQLVDVVVATAAAFSPDGVFIVTAGATTRGFGAQMRETRSGRLLREFTGHTAIVWSVAFSPDGRYLLTGSEDARRGEDNSARLWDAASGLLIRRFDHEAGVRSVAFAPDGAHIVTGDALGVVRLWETESGAETQRYDGHSNLISGLAFSPDGRSLLTGSWDLSARLWDAASGAETRLLRGDWVTAVAYAPDGSYVVASFGDGSVRLWTLTDLG
ncbi:MAG: WD40 repeat domain-containing protein [Chloroflexi bacterium]|nr:WD40 repeat domain-containing protein [Chloroflexota bacterium]